MKDIYCGPNEKIVRDFIDEMNVSLQFDDLMKLKCEDGLVEIICGPYAIREIFELGRNIRQGPEFREYAFGQIIRRLLTTGFKHI